MQELVPAVLRENVLVRGSGAPQPCRRGAPRNDASSQRNNGGLH